MKKRLSALSMLAALAVAGCMSSAALAQEGSTPERPRYWHPTPHLRADIQTAATPLTTWNGSFVYNNSTYHYNMVGGAPSAGKSTTIPVFIIPVKVIVSTSKGPVGFSPYQKISNGQTAMQNIVASPIFAKGIDFTSNGVDLGSTQYIDAFQRGNFWGQVSKAPGYHLLLGAPRVQPALTLTVPSASGSTGTAFGVKVGLVDINWIDTQFQNYLASNAKIVPNSIPVFVTYDTYLTDGAPSLANCCIGGYHNAFGSSATPQAYAHFTYINKPGAFAQDVSALSHELGEWADDPLLNGGNNTPCGILEVGDPEEGEPNYGGFKYTLGGFTYNLQDLTYLPYFGAPASTSAGGSLTFQGNPYSLSVCSNGS